MIYKDIGECKGFQKDSHTYNHDELNQIMDIFEECGYPNLHFFRKSDSSGVRLAQFESNIKACFHRSIIRVLYSPYDEIPLLVNEIDSPIFTALMRWRLSLGR
jgi:hypothetical protein